MPIHTARIHSFQKHILSWWKKNKRDLPWRQTRDPYRILVSELMLQQTQVSRVVPKYHEFLKRFPAVSDLAGASPAEVLRFWKGMGYNRRALYLHNTAKKIVSEYNSTFPVSEKQLSGLPGLGIYTVRALLVFAFEKEVPVIDTNIRKIITHFFFDDIPQKENAIEDVAVQLIPRGKSWEWHQALMDYGAIELRRAKLNRPERSRRATTPFRHAKLNRPERSQRVEHPERSRRATQPFKETKRFYRGRIIDRLREGAVEERILCRECMQNYGKTEDYHEEIIRDLEKDKLVTRGKGVISLPE